MIFLEETLRLISPFYNRIIVATVLLLLGFILGKLVGKLVSRLLSEIELNKIVSNSTSLHIPLESLAGNTISYLIYAVFIMWSLEKLGLGSFIINLLAGGLIVLIVLSIMLAVKDFVPNFIAGIYLQHKGIIKKGDHLIVDKLSGTVTDIELIETKLIKGDEMIFIPNSTLLKSNIQKKRQQSR